MPVTNNVQLGFIGLGVMGNAMAAHLLDAGFNLTVYNRTQSRADALVDAGAAWADSPRDVALQSDIVFSMVGFPQDVEEITLGENGILKGLRKGGIMCDMTTSSPQLAKQIAKRASLVGCFSLDAPVTGGDIGAKNATLSIFVGGDKDAYDRVLPYLEHMGKNFMYCGGPGQGQQAKLANQVAVAGVMFSVCEALLYAREAGLDLQKWVELVVPGAAGSVAMNSLGKRILNNDFEPGFYVEHFVKDLGLCLEECRQMGIVLPGTALADQFYKSMLYNGEGKKGTQLLIEALARLSGKSWKTEEKDEPQEK